MTITAIVIADSISPEGKRLTTLQLRYPRFIHAEFMTHRVFSRNASSSRAIPVQRMIEDLRRDPAMPIYWGSNKPGMQAGTELDPDEIGVCKSIWLNAMETAISRVEWLMRNNLHKQIANRILEPWAHINVVVTATEWANFFALRAHPDAQPEIKALAEAMMAAMGQSDPVLLAPDQWHLPYVDLNGQSDDVDAAENHITANGVLRVVPTWDQVVEVLKKVSVARCARVSYLTHDGRKTTVEEDLALYEKLVVSQPLHASPAEHQATPDEALDFRPDGTHEWARSDLHGNLQGWIQHRKLLANEFVAG